MKISGTRIAVLRGGPSNDYETSLKTGEHVLSILREMPEYHPLDIFISREGEWHRDGLVSEPHEALRHTDLVWNALHGSYGEDGQVQKLLDEMRIPFTGSGTVASALAMNKDMAKRLYRNHFLRTPAHEVLVEEDLGGGKLIEIFRNYMHPVVVRPANAKGSFGKRLAHSFQELKDAVKETFRHSPKVLVEECVSGEEAHCAVLENAKGERLFTFPVSVGSPTARIELKRAKKLSKESTTTIEEMTKRAHEVLGLRHYSNSHFLVTPKDKVYILETQALPALHEGSHLHRSLESAGWQQKDFVDHVIKLTL